MSNYNYQTKKPNLVTQCLFFLIVLVVIVPLSILECKTDNGATFCHVCGTRLVNNDTEQSQKSVIWNIRHETGLTNNCAEQPAPIQNTNDQPYRNMGSSLQNKSRTTMSDQPVGSTVMLLLFAVVTIG